MNIFSTLPKAIINEKIMPYTYEPQPACLIKDIKTLMFTYKSILNMLDTLYEEAEDLGILAATAVTARKDIHISLVKYDIVYYYCEKVLNMTRDSIEFYSYVNFIIEKKNNNIILKILIEMSSLDRLKYLIKLSKGITV